MKTYFLKQNVINGSGQLNGSAGDEIFLISEVADNVDTVIVKNAAGRRFAVRLDNLTEQKAPQIPPTEPEPPPAPAQRVEWDKPLDSGSFKLVPYREAKKKKTKEPPPTLF